MTMNAHRKPDYNNPFLKLQLALNFVSLDTTAKFGRGNWIHKGVLTIRVRKTKLIEVLSILRLVNMDIGQLPPRRNFCTFDLAP